MPTRRIPTTWAGLLRALNIAYTTSQATPDPTKNPLTAAQKAKLDLTNPASLLSRLTKENADVEAALAAQGPVTVELEGLAGRLRKFDAHFHRVLDMAIDREALPSGVGARSFYGRDLASTTIPVLDTYEDLEAVAKKIVEGEAARLTAEGAGAVPMAMPSANEVGALGDEFHDARVRSLLAQRKTNDEREELQALWDEAAALVKEIWDTVEFFFRNDPDASSFRAKCAEWGVAYDYGNQPAPAEENPPPPPA